MKADSQLGVQLILIGIAAGAATLIGGQLALRLRSRLSKLMGFGSGAIIGVALMDLLPEALDLGGGAYHPLTLMALMTLGFMSYLLIHQLIARMSVSSRRLTRHLGPASLVFHSVMDGLGIGVAFNVSPAVGLIVAVAVLTHDVMDGANTITLSLAGDISSRPMRLWLILDAVAPLIGIGVSRMIHTSPQALSLVLAVFAGLFLYIGAAELLPRSRAGSDGPSSCVATVLGAACIYCVVRLSS